MSDRILLTGGAGFIGSHMAEALLARGAAVRVLDDFSTGRRDNLPPGCEIIEGDVADPAVATRAMHGVGGCFHLAAIASVVRSNEDWCGTHRVNAGGTVAVLDAARAGRVPVVYASSAAVYGQSDGAVAEAARLCPRTAYGADKLTSELHARVAWDVHGVPTFGLRLFNVYGPRQDSQSPYSGVISIFAARIAAHRPIEVHGDGGQTRDFVYVADAVTHMLAAFDILRRQPGAMVLNVCTGRPTTIRDLARTLGGLNRRDGAARLRIEYAPARTGDIRCSLGDPVAARTMLGIVAATELRDGLAATLGHQQREQAA